MVATGAPDCDTADFYTSHNVFSLFISEQQFAYCGPDGGMSGSESIEAAQAMQGMEQGIQDFSAGIQDMVDADFSLDAVEEQFGSNLDLSSGTVSLGGGSSVTGPDWDDYISATMDGVGTFESDWTFGVPVSEGLKVSQDPYGPIRFAPQ